MGCVGVRRGLYFFFNIKIDNKFRIDGIINFRGGVLGRESGVFDFFYNKVYYDLKLIVKYCYLLWGIWEGVGIVRYILY